MPQFNYTPSQGAVQSRAVQYDVRPNLSGARAFQNLEKGILGAMQLAGQVKADVRQDNYNEAFTQQTQYLSEFNTRWTEASYDEQTGLEQELQQFASQYDTDDAFGQKLYANAITEHGKYASDLKTRGVREEYVQNLTDQTQGILDLRTEWVEAEGIDDRAGLLQTYDQQFVTPYEGMSDEHSIKLYDNGIKAKEDFEKALATERVNIADNKLVSQSIDFVTATVEMDGTMTQEKYTDMLDKLSQLSTYETNGAKIRANMDARIAESIAAVASRQPLTWENATAFEDNMFSFVNDVAPQLKGTATFSKMNNAVLTFKNAVNTNDMNKLTALVNNDQVRWTEVEDLTNELVARDAITSEVADYQLFLKEEKVKVRDVKGDVANMYVDQNMEGLQSMIERGRGSTVRTVIKGNLDMELSQLSEKIGPVAAVQATLDKVKMFRDSGIRIDKLDSVEYILDSRKDGFQTEDELNLFIDTASAASEAGYQSTSLSKSQKDAGILKVFRDMGVPDLMARYTAYKNNSSKMPLGDKTEAFHQLVDNEWWAENLNHINQRDLQEMLNPAIEAAWKAGLSSDDLDEFWEASIEANFFEADPDWAWSGRVMIPKRGDINNKEAYMSAVDVYSQHHGDGFLSPMRMSDPEGMWAYITEDGRRIPVTFSYVAYASRFGKLKEE